MPPQNRLSVERLGQLIYEIRGQRVMLDRDLAKIYGVTTAALNQAMKRNKARFPADFSFRLSKEEIETLISQNVISKPRRGGRTKPPQAFTEHGALQLANILRSNRAIAMSVYVIRAFIELRDRIATNAAVLRRLAEIDKMLLLHNSALRDVYEKLRPLLAPAPPHPENRSAFTPDL